MRNRIGVVMVGLPVSSALDCGFEHRSGQTKDNKIDICCITAKHTALRKKPNIGWHRIIIKGHSEAT